MDPNFSLASILGPALPRSNSIKFFVENSFLKLDVLKVGSVEYPFNKNDLKSVEILVSERHMVIKYLHEPSNKIVVVKSVPITSSDENLLAILKEKLRQEINIHRYAATNSKYVVDLYGLSFQENRALIIMECMGMSLAELYGHVHRKLGSLSGKKDLRPQKIERTY